MPWGYRNCCQRPALCIGSPERERQQIYPSHVFLDINRSDSRQLWKTKEKAARENDERKGKTCNHPYYVTHTVLHCAYSEKLVISRLLRPLQHLLEKLGSVPYIFFLCVCCCCCAYLSEPPPAIKWINYLQTKDERVCACNSLGGHYQVKKYRGITTGVRLWGEQDVVNLVLFSRPTSYIPNYIDQQPIRFLLFYFFFAERNK